MRGPHQRIECSCGGRMYQTKTETNDNNVLVLRLQCDTVDSHRGVLKITPWSGLHVLGEATLANADELRSLNKGVQEVDNQ